MSAHWLSLHIFLLQTKVSQTLDFNPSYIAKYYSEFFKKQNKNAGVSNRLRLKVLSTRECINWIEYDKNDLIGQIN